MQGWGSLVAVGVCVAGLGVPHLGWQKGVERTKRVRAGGDVEWI